jgi:AraC-like DNA-binding protein
MAKHSTWKGFRFWKVNDALFIAGWQSRCNHSGRMVNSSAHLIGEPILPEEKATSPTASGGFESSYESGMGISQNMDERVEKAVLFMESNCQRTIRLHQIAASAGVSRSRLSALFLAHLEVSPMRFLKTIRMQQARALLESSSLNVKEIAAYAGFNDISHFIRDFIRLYGKSPKTVRNSK